MYSENDLAKATLSVKHLMRKLDPMMHWDEREFKAIAKAALDAQYLPAPTPPSPGSTRCMAYRKAGSESG